MSFLNQKIAPAEDMSGSFNSPAVDIANLIGYSLQAVFTGTPNGTFKLQASCDDLEAPVNWTDVGSSSVAITAAGSAIWNNDGAHYRWVRLVYTRSSGSGSCDVTVAAKG